MTSCLRNYLPPWVIIDKGSSFCHMVWAISVPRYAPLVVWQIVCGTIHVTAQTARQNTPLELKPQSGPLNQKHANSHLLAHIAACFPPLMFFSFPTKKIKWQMNLMLRKALRVRFPQTLNSVSDSLGGLTIDSLRGGTEAKLFVIWSLNPDVVTVAGYRMQRKWLTIWRISSQSYL